MQVETTSLPGVLILQPRVFADPRGFFFESFNERVFAERTGVTARFVQDNHSRSSCGVLRGLHYQVAPHAQGKLVRVVRGAVFDVAVDIRPGSATFGRWVGVALDEHNQRMIWVPTGFAHGFLTLSDVADVLYKTTDYYSPAHQHAIRWDDPEIGIDWPMQTLHAAGIKQPLLSDKDALAKSLREVPL